MRVLQIVADGTPGGGTTNVLALSEDLLERGVDVSFCSQQNSYATQRAEQIGARVVGELDFFKGRLDRRTVKQLAVVAASTRADVVHLHGGRAAFYYARGQHTGSWRTAYTVRGYHFLQKPLPLRTLAAMAERRSSRVIDQTVLVCHYDQRLAARYRLLPAGKQGVVIHNGIRLQDIPPRNSAANLRRVAVLGRLTLQKDPHRVLDIAARLAPAGFHFDLIGGGDMEAEVRQRIQREVIANVTVHGSLARDAALAAMQNCSLFLLASRWEGLPIAPVEAMQMGLAVVVSRVSGNTEVVDDGENGLVVDQSDVDGFAAAVRRLAEDEPLRRRLTAAAVAKVAQRFTRQRVVQQYHQMYQDLLSSGHGR